MNKIKILVCTHKKVKLLDDDIYMPIQVGRSEVNFDLGFQCDNTDINIGDKHFQYSEYTATYWAWKNIKDVDFIGWCHYRRYFLLNKVSKYQREVKVFNEDDIFKNDFSTNSLNKLFKKYDIILPHKRVFPTTIWKIMNRLHDKRDMQITENVVKTLYPEYMKSFDKYLKKTNRLEQLSILITKKEIFDSYCEWLFKILAEIEKNIDFKSNSLHKERKLAFIAEQLSPVYFHHNNLKIKHFPIAWVNNNLINKSWFRYYASNIKSTIRYLLNV